MTALFEFHASDIVWDMTHRCARPRCLSRANGVKKFFQEWALKPFDEYYAHAERFWDAGSQVVVQVRQGGRGKGSGAPVEMARVWQVYELRGGKAVRVAAYSVEREALEAAGLRE